MIYYVKKVHQRLQLEENSPCFQRLLKIGKKNFQTYFICLIAVVQATVILNVQISKYNINVKYYKIAAMINAASRK